MPSLIKILLFLLFTSPILGYSQSVEKLKERLDSAWNNDDLNLTINYCDQIIKLEPSAYNYYLRAFYELYAGNYAAVVRDTRTSERLDSTLSNKASCEKLRGRAYHRNKEYPKAIVELQSAFEKSKDDIELLMILETARWRAGYINEAKQDFEKEVALRQFSYSTDTKIMTTYAEFLNGFYCYDEELVWAKKAYDARPSDIDNFYSYITALTYNNQYDLAQQLCYVHLKSQVFDLDSASFFYTIGQILQISGFHKEAIRYLELACNLDSTIDTYPISKSYYALNEFENARKWILKGIGNEARTAENYNSLAWNSMLAGKYQQALKEINKSLQLKKDPNSIDTRGWVYYRSGQYDLALKDFQQALKMDKLLDHTKYMMGLSYFKLNNPAAACKTLRAIEADEIIYEPGEKRIGLYLENECKNIK